MFFVSFHSRTHPGGPRHSAPVPPGEPEGPLRRHGVSKFVEGTSINDFHVIPSLMTMSTLCPFYARSITLVDMTYCSSPRLAIYFIFTSSTFMPRFLSWGNTILGALPRGGRRGNPIRMQRIPRNLGNTLIPMQESSVNLRLRGRCSCPFTRVG